MPLIQEVDRVCSELKINYYLIGGTLLGAIRHGGFIPWDTDMDIAMKRKDYEIFKEYWLNNSSEKFFYQHYETDPCHLSPHAVLKIKGTHITFNKTSARYQTKCDGLLLDIFPLDEPPAGKKLQEKQQKKIKKIKRILELKAAYTYVGVTFATKKIAKKIVQLALLPITVRHLQRKLDAIMQKYNNGNTGYVVSMASHYSYWKQLMPEHVYGTPSKVEYEGIQLSAPAKIDDYLTRIFGDYMKLPPEDQRYCEMDDILNIDYGEQQ